MTISVKSNKLPVTLFLLWSIIGIFYLSAFLILPDIELFTPIICRFLLFLSFLIWIVWQLWCMNVNRQKFKEADKITKFITHGPYAVVRHPIYFADIIAMFLVIATYPKLWIVVGSSMAVPVIILWAKKEEDVLKQRFGTAYENYAKKKRAFNPFPFLFSFFRTKRLYLKN